MKHNSYKISTNNPQAAQKFFQYIDRIDAIAEEIDDVNEVVKLLNVYSQMLLNRTLHESKMDESIPHEAIEQLQKDLIEVTKLGKKLDGVVRFQSEMPKA